MIQCVEKLREKTMAEIDKTMELLDILNDIDESAQGKATRKLFLEKLNMYAPRQNTAANRINYGRVRTRVRAGIASN